MMLNKYAIFHAYQEINNGSPIGFPPADKRYGIYQRKTLGTEATARTVGFDIHHQMVMRTYTTTVCSDNTNAPCHEVCSEDTIAHYDDPTDDHTDREVQYDDTGPDRHEDDDDSDSDDDADGGQTDHVEDEENGYQDEEENSNFAQEDHDYADDSYYQDHDPEQDCNVQDGDDHGDADQESHYGETFQQLQGNLGSEFIK